jgi:hypothetical protein
MRGAELTSTFRPPNDRPLSRERRNRLSRPPQTFRAARRLQRLVSQPLEKDLTTGNPGKCIDNKFTLPLSNAGPQLIDRIAPQYGNLALGNDRAGVVLGVNQMYRHPGLVLPRFEHRLEHPIPKHPVPTKPR